MSWRAEGARLGESNALVPCKRHANYRRGTLPPPSGFRDVGVLAVLRERGSGEEEARPEGGRTPALLVRTPLGWVGGGASQSD